MYVTIPVRAMIAAISPESGSPKRNVAAEKQPPSRSNSFGFPDEFSAADSTAVPKGTDVAFDANDPNAPAAESS
ncbi:hypothetical protein HK405_006027, partial [Cladochytrium tenue]